MSFFDIKGTALEFNVLMSCISNTTGTRGQNRVKDLFVQRILKDVFPELDPDREDLVRIDDQSPEAKTQRTMQMDTTEQGVLAEAFLEAVTPKTTPSAKYRLFRQAAAMIKVSAWFDKQTTEKLPAFAGEADTGAAIQYADAAPAAA